MTAQPVTGPLPEHMRVAITGAGFSGLGAGIRLRQAGRAGLNPTLRPGSVRGFRQATRRVSLDEYQLIPARSDAATSRP